MSLSGSLIVVAVEVRSELFVVIAEMQCKFNGYDISSCYLFRGKASKTSDLWMLKIMNNDYLLTFVVYD